MFLSAIESGFWQVMTWIPPVIVSYLILNLVFRHIRALFFGGRG